MLGGIQTEIKRKQYEVNHNGAGGLIMQVKKNHFYIKISKEQNQMQTLNHQHKEKMLKALQHAEEKRIC